jgi:Ni,Fe-hydrogenase maturation factor
MTRVLIGGVGYRWQGDASFGLAASDALARESWPDSVEVADLGYGALYVTQDLSDAHPPYTRLVLLAGVGRGRTPGALYRGEWQPPIATPAEVQERVREAGAGVIDLDHLLVIASYFGALPADVVTLEFEPIDLAGADLSPAAAALLPEVLARARSEALAPVREAIRA